MAINTNITRLQLLEEFETLRESVRQINRIMQEAPEEVANRAEAYWLGYLNEMVDLEEESRAIMVMPWQTLEELRELAEEEEE